MTTRQKPDCDELYQWLRLNLGRGALAPITGTDDKALRAAVHVLRLYAYNGHAQVLESAFRACVMEMQPSTRELAYHAIAYVSEWHYRELWWAFAGLEPLERVSHCAGER